MNLTSFTTNNFTSQSSNLPSLHSLLYKSPSLASGLHTLVMKLTPTSSHPNIYFDYILFTPTPGIPILAGSLFYDDTSPSVTYQNATLDQPKAPPDVNFQNSTHYLPANATASLSFFGRLPSFLNTWIISNKYEQVGVCGHMAPSRTTIFLDPLRHSPWTLIWLPRVLLTSHPSTHHLSKIMPIRIIYFSTSIQVSSMISTHRPTIQW